MSRRATARSTQTNEEAPETPAPGARVFVPDEVREDPLLPGVDVPIRGRVAIYEDILGRVSHIIPEPIETDPNEPQGRRNLPQPQAGSEPWANLGDGRAPPLFQRPAPQHPFRVGIDAKQAERQRWRQEWHVYALNLVAIINKLITLEEARDDTDRAVVQAYADTIASIQHDVQTVLEQNPDIVPVGGRQNAVTFNPTAHSYLAYSGTLLGRHQTQLESYLGDGRKEAWQIGENNSVRRYGEQFPDDGFREILHYRPQDLGASWWSRSTTMDQVMFYMTLAVIAILGGYFAFHLILYLYNLFPILRNHDWKATWLYMTGPSSWPGRLYAYISEFESKVATDTASPTAPAQNVNNAFEKLTSTSGQSATSSPTSQVTGSTDSAGKIFAEEIVFKVAGTMKIGPKL